jgi:PAS domain-containing protein
LATGLILVLGWWAGERSARLADSELRAHLVSVSLALVAMGGLLVLLWAVSSRSERQLKRSFARVHASEARYRALFESLATGVVLVAPDGRLVESNPAARRILGWIKPP